MKKAKYSKDTSIGKLRTLDYKIRFFLRKGQKEYCKDCLISTKYYFASVEKHENYYPYWLLNTGRARLKPVGQCSHK